MKGRTTRQERRAKKRAAKESGMRAPGTRSRYARKQIRKRGSGTVDPRWMWWLERGAAA